MGGTSNIPGLALGWESNFWYDDPWMLWFFLERLACMFINYVSMWGGGGGGVFLGKYRIIRSLK